MIPLRVVIPGLKLVSEANARGRWYAGAKRAADQRSAVAHALRAHRPPPVPADVRIVRVAPCALDDDNCARAAKAVRDEVARWLGVDDRDDRITWHVGQKKSRAGVYAVEVVLRPWSPAAVGARVREVWEETEVDLTLGAATLGDLAAKLGRVAEGPARSVAITVHGVRLVLRVAGGGPT